MTGRRRPAAALLAASLVALPVAGCGVRPSGVIRGGPAPTVTADGVTLYFLAGPTLTPVLRPTRSPLWATQSLELLQAGPDRAERAADLTSEVPAGLGPVTVAAAGSGVDVVVSTDVRTLSAAAVDQVVCTVRDALSTAEPVTVRSVGASRGPRTCPLPG